MATLLSYALTNTSDVKESLGIASSDTTKDNLIIRKINQATRAIENYCGRRFALTTYTQEEYTKTDIDQIVLQQRPVTTFTSFEVRNSGLNYDNWETVDPHFYFVENNAGILNLTFRAYGTWKSYRATYSAGYAPIPEDLSEACVSLACYYVQNADASDVGVLQKKEGQRELRYSNGSLKFKTILENLGIDEIVDAYSNMPVMTDR